MLACYHCGKVIKGQAVSTSPSNLRRALGLDFPKSYHPACYKKAEKQGQLIGGYKII